MQQLFLVKNYITAVVSPEYHIRLLYVLVRIMCCCILGSCNRRRRCPGRRGTLAESGTTAASCVSIVKSRAENCSVIARVSRNSSTTAKSRAAKQGYCCCIYIFTTITKILCQVRSFSRSRRPCVVCARDAHPRDAPIYVCIQRKRCTQETSYYLRAAKKKKADEPIKGGWGSSYTAVHTCCTALHSIPVDNGKSVLPKFVLHSVYDCCVLVSYFVLSKCEYCCMMQGNEYGSN